MKAKNFKVISKSGSVMIQAADIDGALQAYRLDALDENVLCIRESGIIEAELAQQPTLSKESVMEVAEKHGAYKEQISNDEWAFNIEDFTLESFIEAISNLTPAVSEQPDVSEWIKHILYAKFMQVLPDSEFKVIHAEEHADDVIESIQPIQPAKGEKGGDR